MVTRRLQKKVSRNNHFSRPAETDPYVWSHICLNGLELEIHERNFEAIYFQKVVQSDNDLFSHYRTIYMDLMSVNLSVKTLHSLKRRGERVGQPGSENIIFYTKAWTSPFPQCVKNIRFGIGGPPLVLQKRQQEFRKVLQTWITKSSWTWASKLRGLQERHPRIVLHPLVALSWPLHLVRRSLKLQHFRFWTFLGVSLKSSVGTRYTVEQIEQSFSCRTL